MYTGSSLMSRPREKLSTPLWEFHVPDIDHLTLMYLKISFLLPYGSFPEDVGGAMGRFLLLGFLLPYGSFSKHFD